MARSWPFALLLTCSVACGVDTAPAPARRTPAGNGPEVVFDITRRPLPEIPQPNDIATFADPTSRTGRRINVSLTSPTRLESAAREGFTSMEGWGTFAPITVAFARDAKTPTTSPAIDLDDVAARTRDWDPSDDPFYVIDLTTGIPVPLEMGRGAFPLAVVDPAKYWANDPRASESTLLYETVEEGAGLPQSAYRPELDTDFDGVLDHPNVLHPDGRSARIEDVIPWYERETDTLVLRPVVPLEEMREYAVVLTDRLKGPDGQPVRSPFAGIHHAQQRDGAERVGGILGDASKKNWYGDLAGSGLSHVAFTWTFTTQPVYDDMRLLRDGMHGKGPLSRLEREFPPAARAAKAVGLALDPADEPPGGVDADPTCAPFKGTPYIVRVAQARDTLSQLLQTALGLKGQELDRLLESLDNVDHFVIGSFESPFFLGDPKKEDPDGRFQINFKTGEGRVTRDTVQFWLSVPKTTATAKQPFPTTVWAHGTTLHADEIIVRAGYWARQGIAMMGINMPGHGLYLDPGLQTVAQVFFRETCMVPWVTAIGTGRQQDLNGDGVPDSGGLLWTAHLFHSRDNIRQSVVDEMQATRVLRAWDGVLRSDQDYNADGAPDLAGDFDGDGVPDVGGPAVPITTAGDSFGGVVAMVHGAVDPNVTASGPISGGGGLTDIATRSALVPDSVLEQIFSPLVVAVPASTVAKDGDLPRTQCTGDQRSVRFVVNDLTNSREVEIACLSPAELDVGRTVVLENLRNGERRCARTSQDGRFRVPIPANVGDRLDVQIYDAPDVVTSYKGCDVPAGAPIGRRIHTFEQTAVHLASVADESKTCDAAFAASGLDQNNGCAQFRDSFYPVGSALVAPQEGLGYLRQSPETRRLFNLTQAAVDPADPINFAPYYALRSAPGPDGAPMPPRTFASFVTAGDPMVPSASGYAFARAAGAVPFLPPSFADTNPEWAAYATPRALWDSLGGKTPDEVLIASWAVEGLARLGRTSAGPTCKPNYVASAVCTSPPSASECSEAIADADWLAEGKNLWDAPHPKVPLRLARAADVRATDTPSLERAWAPRLTGVPFAPDESAWHGSQPLLATLDAWMQPAGQHVFVNADPCQAFDDVVYLDGLLVRFLATEGKDLYLLGHPSTHHCLEREACPFQAR
jgi:hypothetical protein